MNQKWNIVRVFFSIYNSSFSFDPTDHFYTLYARVTQKKLANKLATWNKTPKYDYIAILEQAIYFESANGIYVGALFLELRFYKPNVPDYVNFAGIGNVIGHEFLRGFHPSDLVHDEKGNLKNW
uniref:Peptidase_M13 domain-containing protein n=1 Tax=Panagrellus redivivus TaxID=6233 RepID=A0A7E4W5X3_PANRE